MTGQVTADVAIVGAGFTALWAAYYLVQARPSLQIVLVDAQPTGSHARAQRASGLTSLTARVPSRFGRSYGATAVGRLQGALIETVDALFAVLEAESIEAQARRGGSIRVARHPAQERRLAALARGQQRWGAPPQWLEGSALRDRVHIYGATAATWWPHTATVEPGALSSGLAAALRRRGVRIFGDTQVLEIRSGQLATALGDLHAPVVIRATEDSSDGAVRPVGHRGQLPVSSAAIVTEPLPSEFWGAVTWRRGESLSDAAYPFVRAARTRDDQIVLGRRTPGFGGGPLATAQVDGLRAVLRSWFPQLSPDVAITRSWSGVAEWPRDCCASVNLDQASGLGWIGGFADHGLVPANLAGRILRDLVLGGSGSRLTDLPLVGWPTPCWEPEPLRWLGTRGGYGSYRLADRVPRSVARLAPDQPRG